jgi:DNA gyrase inhibitor GyrI
MDKPQETFRFRVIAKGGQYAVLWATGTQHARFRFIHHFYPKLEESDITTVQKLDD